MVGNGVGARSGILFKTAEALQQTGSVNIIALDKTGTITSGKPVVTDVITVGCDEGGLIRKAASLEKNSEHPLAKAIMEYAANAGIREDEVTGFSALPGNGLYARLDGRRLIGGSANYVESVVNIPIAVTEKMRLLASAGKTPVVFAEDDKILGVIGIADVIKPDSAAAVEELKNMGLHVVMLTGDNQRTAASMGEEAHVDKVISDVLPDGKEAVIRKLQQSGSTMMVGDGINDAPALTSADIGIAIGAGTDVAIDAADVVLMKSNLSDVAAAIRLSRQTYKNIKENLFWALIYNVLLIPLACGLYVRFGLTMNPMWGAAAMSCSSIFVVLNALRLNLFDIYNSKHDRPGKRGKTDLSGIYDGIQKGEKIMTKTVKIEGMMCEHCAANVKGALEALDGIENATVSHESGTAVIELSADVSEDAIKEAVTGRGYTYVGLE
jgi:Cu2+-exporting ATPase